MVLRDAIAELRRAFGKAPHKRAAHALTWPILEQIARDPRFVAEALEAYVMRADSLTRKNYPVIAVPVESNPDFELVMHCWIPLPTRETDITTKAIHHHANLLLSTANAFGPGYDHMMFSRPRRRAGTDFHDMQLVQRRRHALHEVAFVDAFVAHLPIYPASLSITLALWSTEADTTWRDHLKRVPALKKRKKELRELAIKLGLTRSLEVILFEDLDFYPTPGGFRMIKERQEFPLGPNEDHLHSLFHVLQETDNAALGAAIRDRVARERPPSAGAIEGLLARLQSGQPIEGRLSPGHYDVPFANFRVAEVERTLGLGQREEEIRVR